MYGCSAKWKIGWGYKEVKRELQELTGYSVCVENDANLAALGEFVSYLLQDDIPDLKGYKPIEILNPSVLLESEE